LRLARDLAEQREALERARRAHDQLAAELAAAEQGLRRMERSRSWRLTAPLRALVRLLSSRGTG
jgi:hypothetical protein